MNISALIKKYGPGYVAKNKKSGKVIAHAKRLDILFSKTGDKDDITISWIPKGNAKYVFRISLPFLLGRKDIFENTFNLFIDSKKKMTVISKI